MAVIKVTDIAYARLRSPISTCIGIHGEFRAGPERQDQQRGLLPRHRPVHHLHITEKGEPKFIGIAYHAASEDDLKTLAKVPARRASRTWMSRAAASACA